MGRVASAGDNAAMEPFFSLLQKNVLDRQTWATRSELRYAIVTWIERTYNHRRRQRRLGAGRVQTRFHTTRRSRGMVSHNHRQPNLQQTQSLL